MAAMSGWLSPTTDWRILRALCMHSKPFEKYWLAW
jgi:hypothetical protein